MSQRRPGSTRWFALVWCLAGVAACGSKGVAPSDASMDREGATAGTTGAGGAGTTGSSAGGSSGLGGMGGSGGLGGGGTGFPPGCHYDCFGGTSCLNGVVTSYQSRPVGCAEWTGSCPIASTRQCQQGCTLEIHLASIWGDPSALCAETPNAKLGDSCFGNRSPCVPTRASDGPDGGIATTHLECDPTTSKCVASPGPPLEDFGTACKDPALAASTRTGYSYFPSCPKTYCLRFADQAAGCVRSGCTSYCAGDHDCPSGWFCDKTLENLTPNTGGSTTICRPGPRAGIPKTLACLPP